MTDQLWLLRQVIVFITVLCYWGGVIAHARRIKKQIGHSPNLRPRSPGEWTLWAGWCFVILGSLGQAALLPMLQPIWLFTPGNLINPATSILVGITLVIAGYSGTLWCYATMKDSWRIGINTQEKTTLITAGPYRCVRHPIYSFQISIFIAAGILIPTLFSLLFITCHWICCRRKALDEEQYLLTIHGQSYRHYRAISGRFLPRWETLRRTVNSYK